MALSPGEQALFDKAVASGQTSVTSSFVPAASRAAVNAALASQSSGGRSSTPSISSSAQIGGMMSSGSSGGSSGGGGSSYSAPVVEEVVQPIQNTGLIEQIYKEELGRALGTKEGDVGAIDYWLGRLNEGATPEQVRKEIEGSPEGTVFDAYTGLLKRDPDPEGSQYWQQQLITGALTPEQLQRSFLQSEEAMSRTFENSAQQAVADLLETSLGRSVTDESLDFWTSQYENAFNQTGDVTTALNLVRGGIQSSPEFLGRSVTSAVTDIFGQPIGESQTNAIVQSLQEQISSGVPVEQALSTLYSNLTGTKQLQDVQEQISADDPLQSTNALRNYFYSALQSGQKLGPGEIERLVGPERQNLAGTLDDPYTRTAVAYVNAQGLLNYNEALEAGDSKRAANIIAQLQDPLAYYEANKSSDPWNEIRDNIVGADSLYGRGDAKGGGWLSKFADDILGIDDSGGIVGSAKAFLENPIEALDRWKDMPAAKIATFAVFGPLGSSVLSAYNTLDSGENLSTSQILALLPVAGQATQVAGLASASEISRFNEISSNLTRLNNVIENPKQAVINELIKEAGGKNFLISSAGAEFEDEALQGLASGVTAALIEEATGGNGAVAFLKELKGTEINLPFSGQGTELLAKVEDFLREVVPTETLAQIEDSVRDNLKPLAQAEDWVRRNVDASGVEDWVRENASAVEDGIRSLGDKIPYIPFEPPVIVSNVSIPGGGGSTSKEEIVRYEELAGGEFTPKKGRQGGLAVDTDFLYDEPSLALAILQGRA